MLWGVGGIHGTFTEKADTERRQKASRNLFEAQALINGGNERRLPIKDIYLHTNTHRMEEKKKGRGRWGWRKKKKKEDAETAEVDYGANAIKFLMHKTDPPYGYLSPQAPYPITIDGDAWPSQVC